MKLIAIHGWNLEFQFRDGPYVMSYVTQDRLTTRVLRITAEDGTCGYGEVVRSARYAPETCEILENETLVELEPLSIQNLPILAHHLRVRDIRLYGLAFALETAHLDFCAKKANAPLFAFLGGSMNQSVTDYLSIGCATPQVIHQKIRDVGATREVIQVKLGEGQLDLDFERIETALRVATQNQRLLLDFNGALNVEQALSVVQQYEDSRIVWEELCNNVPMNIEVAQRTGKNILFDQCLKSLQHYAAVCSQPITASVCIKPAAPLGGLSVARVARDMALDAGLSVRIDGPWSGPIGSAAALHLALGAPPEKLIAGCDLTEPLVLGYPWKSHRKLPGDRIAPLQGNGHGVELPETAIFETLWQRG